MLTLILKWEVSVRHYFKGHCTGLLSKVTSLLSKVTSLLAKVTSLLVKATALVYEESSLSSYLFPGDGVLLRVTAARQDPQDQVRRVRLRIPERELLTSGPIPGNCRYQKTGRQKEFRSRQIPFLNFTEKNCFKISALVVNKSSPVPIPGQPYDPLTAADQVCPN